MTFVQQSAHAQTAQEPSTETPVARSAASTVGHDDLVVLKNGTRYRGTIVETVPGDHLLIQLTGDLVREVPMLQVQYAGPLAGASALPANPTVATPLAPPTTPTVAPPMAGASAPPASPTVAQPQSAQQPPRQGEALVHFQSETPGLMVWLSRLSSPTDSSAGIGYTQICQAPCAVPVAIGSYRLAVSAIGGKIITLGNRIHIQREAWLQTNLSSRRSVRVAGWVALGLGAATGTLLISTAASLPNGREHRKDYATWGAVSLAAAIAIGLPLGLVSDSAVVVSIPSPVAAPASATGTQGSFTGLSFVGRF